MKDAKKFDVVEIIEHFSLVGHFEGAIQYGNGYINDTFLLITRDGDERYKYILQRIVPRHPSILLFPFLLKKMSLYKHWNTLQYIVASITKIALLSWAASSSLNIVSLLSEFPISSIAARRFSSLFSKGNFCLFRCRFSKKS